MPSLRIPFPEKDSPSVVTLRGKRITVGRLPENTIQIRDRTISAHHAELIEEDGHYRLHDLGATNGILVNGEAVTDFHLEESCKVTFGGVECEFSPEAATEAEEDPALAIMTHGQSEALVAKNTELEATVASLRAQIAELQKPVGDSEGASELQRLTDEASTLRESVAARDREIKQLKIDLSVMQRDRTNLQRALSEAKAKPEPVPTPTSASPAAAPQPEPEPAPEAAKQPELDLAPAAAASVMTEAPKPSLPPIRPLPKPVPGPASTPAPASAPAPAAASAPSGETPKPTSRPAAVPVPVKPWPSAKPAATPAPAGTPTPAAAPAPAANAPAASPVEPPSKPSLPKPKAPLPHGSPGAPATPSNPGSAAAARPVARPQPAVASNGNGIPGAAPRSAAPIAKSPGGTNPQATSKPSLATRPPTAVSGPKGTQKIET